MYVVSSRWHWSFLMFPLETLGIYTGDVAWTQQTQIPALGLLATWDYEDIPLCHLLVFVSIPLCHLLVFLSFPLRFTIHLELTFVGLIVFHLDGQLIKQHLLEIDFPAHWYWVSEWMNESHLVVSDSFQPPGLYTPWNSLGQDTVVGSISLL